MAFQVKHAFTSPIVDEGDPTLVGPNEWNAPLVVTGTANRLVGLDAGGAGGEVTLGTGLALAALALTLSANLQSWSGRDPALTYTSAQTDTAITSGIATHVGLADPHPQYALDTDLAAYLTTAAAAAAYQPLDADLTSWAAITRAAGFDTFATTPTSVNLKSLVTDETGAGALVFGTSPTISTKLTLTGASEAGASNPVLDTTQTWNNVATTFTGWKLNVTDTNSAAGSLLIDLQVATVSKFSVNKSGDIAGYRNIDNGGGGYGYIGSCGIGYNGGSTITLVSGGSYNWSSIGSVGGTLDLYMLRDAAGIMAIRNGTNGQGIRVYNTFTDASNYERARLSEWISNACYVGPVWAGTGNARNLILGTFGTGGGAGNRIEFWTNNGAKFFMDGNGALTCASDKGGDIGTAALRVNDIYVGHSLIGSSGTITTSNPILDLSQTWNAGAVAFTGIKLNVTKTAAAATSLLQDWQVGGSSVFAVQVDGYLVGPTDADMFGNACVTVKNYFRIANGIFGLGAVGNCFALWEMAGQQVVVNGSGVSFGWSSSSSADPSTLRSNFDTKLFRDAAGIIAQRNSTNAQQHRWYRSFTDASNYSRFAFGWNTTTALLLTEGAGTGGRGNLAFGTAALATNATVGYIMIPSCAGAPTGVPADIPTGQVPLHYDSTNNQIYVYNGAWKKTVALT